jgi:2-polyprenyl-6-methoxyphenol hydroxylase-like FAD-dependent oxidoreductase
MQPRTVEVLASRGFADDMLATGQRVESGHYAMLSSRLDYTPLESPFPFIVSYPQLTLEERLESYLLAQGVLTASTR